MMMVTTPLCQRLAKAAKEADRLAALVEEDSSEERLNALMDQDDEVLEAAMVLGRYLIEQGAADMEGD